MKFLVKILLITLFLSLTSIVKVAAQHRNERTSSARAAYGLPAEKYKPKKKKNKKFDRNGQPKLTQSKNKEVKRRRRDSWAG
jgi:hypothetical protein